MSDESERLKSAIASIHNHLHAGNVNLAHEACECAMSGQLVSQPNLTLPQSARVQTFAAKFNALAVELDVRAAFLLMMPSATAKGYTSLQIGGEVGVCKFIESKLGGGSIYQGEHR